MFNFKNFQRKYRENIILLKSAKFIVDIIMVVCVAFVLISFTCTKTTISGNSMNNPNKSSLENGDVLLINKMKYSFSQPSRYDVIAFERPNITSSKTYIKRVIALPGETIQIKDGKVYINDAVLNNDVSTDNIMTGGLASSPLTLGENEYFVLGDNRNNSEDSRFANIGTVKREDIVGAPWLIVSPISHFKPIS